MRRLEPPSAPRIPAHDVLALLRTAFSGQDALDIAAKYLDDLRARMNDIRTTSRRTVALLLLVAASFELLNRAAVSNVQLGPLQIRDLGPIQKALPVVFAYLIYEQVALGVRYLYSWTVASGIAGLFQPSLRATGLDELLNPIGSALFGPMDWYQSNTLTRRMVGVFNIALRGGSLSVPLVIEGYALYQLFKVFGSRDVVVWFSTLFSLGFISFAALVVLTSLTDKLVRFRMLAVPR